MNNIKEKALEAYKKRLKEDEEQVLNRCRYLYKSLKETFSDLEFDEKTSIFTLGGYNFVADSGTSEVYDRSGGTLALYPIATKNKRFAVWDWASLGRYISYLEDENAK